eukprot:8749349-Alexandrium_andersonii.AAC.1
MRAVGRQRSVIVGDLNGRIRGFASMSDLMREQSIVNAFEWCNPDATHAQSITCRANGSKEG